MCHKVLNGVNIYHYIFYVILQDYHSRGISQVLGEGVFGHYLGSFNLGFGPILSLEVT